MNMHFAIFIFQSLSFDEAQDKLKHIDNMVEGDMLGVSGDNYETGHAIVGHH